MDSRFRGNDKRVCYFDFFASSSGITSMKKTDLPEILQTTLALAEKWQNRANTLRTKDELKQQQMMRRLLNHPSDKTVVMHLVIKVSAPEIQVAWLINSVIYFSTTAFPVFFRKLSNGYSRYFCISAT